MSCNTCQSKFGLFARERGCPNCGFSYCGKCLKYKCTLSDGSCDKVCGPCYNKSKMTTNDSSADSSGISSPRMTQRPLAPVDIADKLESLGNPAKPPIVIYKQAGHWENLKTGLDPADREIVERLKKLKDLDERGAPPGEDEIRRRLAILRDQDPDRARRTTEIGERDARTDGRKEDDLARECLESLELSLGNEDAARQIETRLNSLKGLDATKKYSAVLEDDEDEETATKKIIKKALAEAALEAKYRVEELEESEEMEVEHERAPNSEDEVSCCMCDQTKRLIRCSGCTGDLYCEMCFEDNHDDCEMSRHKILPYEKTTAATPPD